MIVSVVSAMRAGILDIVYLMMMLYMREIVRVSQDLLVPCHFQFGIDHRPLVCLT